MAEAKASEPFLKDAPVVSKAIEPLKTIVEAHMHKRDSKSQHFLEDQVNGNHETPSQGTESAGEGQSGSHCVVLGKKLPTIAQFSTLEQNSNLNLPPPDWMRQTSQAGQYFQRLLFSQFQQPPYSLSHPPSSILLASNYPDKVGRVDVIADAKNVKQLLMMPYSHSDVSITIHKVGNTLLMDELKPSMLLENPYFKELFREGILPQNFVTRKKHPASSHHRNMFSKLLYYSLHEGKGTPSFLPLLSDTGVAQSHTHTLSPIEAETKDHTHIVSPDGTRSHAHNVPKIDQEEQDHTHISSVEAEVQSHTHIPSQAIQVLESEQSHERDSVARQQEEHLTPPPSVSGCVFPTTTPGPILEERSDDTRYDNEDVEWNEEGMFPCSLPEPISQPFHLNVEWTIKDIRMLLGSDLPIFGRSGHPAISLKLRDMQKPITVLTGLDYWLDNLMCNVPELVMCFHINGIVQNYEKIKTEDIPRNANFSPDEIQEVAQNILSFLKSNCTREGHTYWLFRPKGDEVVKLYDLTSLLEETGAKETAGEHANPYAVNVALLFYRVSQRMMRYEAGAPEDLAIIKLLLDNCIKLLKDDKNSQIVISSYYLLGDLVLSRVPSTGSPGPSVAGDDEKEGVVESGVRVLDEMGVDRTQETKKRKHRKPRHDSLVQTNYEAPSLMVSNLRGCSVNLEATPTAPPLEPLVIGSRQDRARITLGYVTEGLTVLSGEMEGWKMEAGIRLLQLASRSYWILAQVANELNKMGRSLRYLRLCILCHKASGAKCSDLYDAWQLVGDIHCLSTKVAESFQSHFEDLRSHNPDDSHVLEAAMSLYTVTVREDSLLSLHKELENCLKKSIECYEHCQQLIKMGGAGTAIKERKRMLNDRLGNAWNELGVYYKRMSPTLDFREESTQVLDMWDNSRKCFLKGLDHFNSTHNTSNQALLNANLGGLMRMAAETYHLMCVGGDEVGVAVEGEVTREEEEYCNLAVQYYNMGQEVLKKAKTDRSIWYSIESDLAAVHFTQAQQLQERPPLSRRSLSEVERQVLAHFMKALHHAESSYGHTHSGSAQCTFLSQFIGNCHQRIASLYIKMANTSTAGSPKLKFTQAEKHYNKALQYYSAKHHQLQVVRVHLEKAFAYEQEASNVNNKQLIQTRLLHQSLDSLLCIREVLSQLREQSLPGEREEAILELLRILVQRLQAVTRQLAARKGHSTQCFKRMYGTALRMELIGVVSTDVCNVMNWLDDIHKIYSSVGTS